MKSNKGITLIKLVIAIIILIIIGFLFVILLKLGVIKLEKKENDNFDIKDEAIEERIERKTNHTDTMTFITSTENEYVFIDDEGHVIQLPRTIIGNKSIEEGTVFYNDNILIEKDNKYKVIDFEGNTLFEADKTINTLINTKEKTIYGFSKDNKYGVIDSNGKLVLQAVYSEKMEGIEGIDYFYTFGYNYNPKGEKYLITIFNKKGELVYETDSSLNTLQDAKTCKTLNGINVIIIPKNKKTVEVVNLNSGELIKTIDLKEKTEVEIRDEGNVLVLDWYELGKKNKRNNEQKIYYWFGKDEKISRQVKFEPNSGEAYVDGVKYFVLIKEGSKSTITDKYGEDIYTTNNPIQMVEYQAREGSQVYPFLFEQTGNKQYKIMDYTGKAILYERLDKVGNKYLQVGNTLYRQDGVKYMDNVSKYYSINDLDIIVTKDRIYVENSDGRVAERTRDYSMDSSEGLIDENTIICKNGGYLLAIDIRNLTMKSIDLSSNYNIKVHNGYITALDKDKTNYYNKDGKLLYQIYK